MPTPSAQRSRRPPRRVATAATSKTPTVALLLGCRGCAARRPLPPHPTVGPGTCVGTYRVRAILAIDRSWRSPVRFRLASCESGAAHGATRVPMPTKRRLDTPHHERPHQYYLYYNDIAGEYTKVAGAYGATAAVLAVNPDPTLSKGGAAVAGIIAAGVGWHSASLSQQANEMAAIEHDPLDPNWHTVAARPRTYPGRLPTVPGLGHRQQAAIHAYFSALLSEDAGIECEIESINRATTALVHKDRVTAASQYRAGASCATANAKTAKLLPRLSTHARPVVAALASRLNSPSAKRYLNRHFAADERKAAFRKKVAAKIIAGLQRVIALPTPVIVQLQGILAKPASTAATTPSKLLKAFFASSQDDAAWGALQEQTAQVLAAAAAAAAK